MKTHFRTHTRLPHFDYRANHAYFITAVTANRACVFGSIVDGILRPTRRGLIVQEMWNDLPKHHSFIELDAFVMPNHVHGIVCFTGNDVPSTSDVGRLAPRSTGSVVGSFKSAVTRTINRVRPGAATRLWQTNFYEHVVRSDRSLDRIREYILTNPSRWDDDAVNDAGTGKDDVEVFTRSLRADEWAALARGDAGVAAT